MQCRKGSSKAWSEVRGSMFQGCTHFYPKHPIPLVLMPLFGKVRKPSENNRHGTVSLSFILSPTWCNSYYLSTEICSRPKPQWLRRIFMAVQGWIDLNSRDWRVQNIIIALQSDIHFPEMSDWGNDRESRLLNGGI